jgi:hypothetical protein
MDASGSDGNPLRRVDTRPDLSEGTAGQKQEGMLARETCVKTRFRRAETCA